MTPAAPGTPKYAFRHRMATDPKLRDNPLNKHFRDWWDAERRRIEAIRSNMELHP